MSEEILRGPFEGVFENSVEAVLPQIQGATDWIRSNLWLS
jgi:hypothetical protein